MAMAPACWRHLSVIPRKSVRGWVLLLSKQEAAELGELEIAGHCISEAITTVETTKETWYEAEVHYVVGEILLKSPERNAEKAEAHLDANERGRFAVPSESAAPKLRQS